MKGPHGRAALRLRLVGDCGPGPDISGACRAGMVPASETGAGSMPQSLNLAHARGWNLATTLLVCIVVFRAGDGKFAVMPSSEYDGDPAAIVHVFDPFEI